MNSSLTFRLPALAVPAEGGQTSMAPAASVAANSETLDETLIIQICEGSREALAVLFRRYARLVRGVSFRVLRDASEADDLVQEIFLLVYRDCHTFDRSKGPARSWILQMAYHRAISRRRYLTSRHFYTRLDLDDGASQLADPRASRRRFEDSVAGRLGTGGLQRAFEALSENQRRTLQLHFFEGYTFGEIASELGQSTGNIRHHYFRGLNRLRKQIFDARLRAIEGHRAL